jgi:hypothetical protein
LVREAVAGRSQSHDGELVEAGVIERKESGAVSFPYDAVRVYFVVKAA